MLSVILWLNNTFFCMKSLPLLQGCDFRDWEWQSTAADQSGSTSCVPFETPHQWRPRERAPGAQGPGQCEREAYTHMQQTHTEPQLSQVIKCYYCFMVVSPCCPCSPGSSSQKRILTTAWPSLSPAPPPPWHHNTRRHPSPRSSLKI